MHLQHMWSPRNIRMNRHRKAKLLVIFVKVIEVIHPQLFNDLRVHPAMAVWCLLDEHHGRQIVDVPGCRDLDEPGWLPLDQRLHPLFRLLAVIDLRPGIPDSEPVHLGIIMAHAVIILNAITEQKLSTLFTRFPPRRHASSWRPAAELSEHAVRLIEDITLLLQGHIGRVLVGIAVESDFVATVSDQGALFGEGFKRMAWDKPSCFHVVLLEEFEEAADTDCAGEHAWEGLSRTHWRG
jgi:hypothetical protein